MATAPQFAATPLSSGISTGTTASTTPFGTPSAPVTVYTAPTGGARIDQINVVGLGTTSATQIILYIYNGTTYWPITTVLTTATTTSATVAPFTYTLTFDNLMLPATYSIRASLFAADTSGYMITAFGGTFA